MKRVAEVMYIVPEEREAFFEKSLHPSEEDKKVLWTCGVRNQHYFGINGLVVMTFEYEGDHFKEDMQKMSAYLSAHGHLIEKRRRDVPPAERDITNWWAPVKKLGSILETSPFGESGDIGWEDPFFSKHDGGMVSTESDMSYDEEDWTDDFHF